MTFVFFMSTESAFSCVVSIYISIIIGMLVAVIQPYKSAVYNTVDTILVLSLGLIYTGVTSYFIAYIEDPQSMVLSRLMGPVPLLIPLVYVNGYWGYDMCVIKKIPQRMLRKILSSLLWLFQCVQKLWRRTEMDYLSECSPLVH